MNNVRQLLKHRNANASAQEKCPEDLFSSPYPVKELCKWLCRFVCKTRKEDGQKYPSKTIYQILCGVLRFMRGKILRQQTSWIRIHASALHGTCDSLFHQLHEAGIGTETKEVIPFMAEEEEKLWATVFDTNDPTGLQRAVFFYLGKVLCLRGGQEQRDLKPSQFSWCTDPDRFVYVEHGSKNQSGSLKQIHVENKVVPVYCNPAAGERDLAWLLDFYLSKLPRWAFENDVFYCKPLNKCPMNPTAPWYCTRK